jgi:hypothetical protein
MRIGPGVHRQTGSSAPVQIPNRPRRQAPFTAILDERVGSGSRPAAAPAIEVAARTPAARDSPKPPPVAPARALLERVAAAENRIDALLRAAAGGKTFSPGELLALQASVFRYSQTVEVVSRVADRLVGAVKQTMGTQV